MRFTLGVLITVALTGCAGLSIAPISPDKANKAHTDGASVSGYIVYHPMVVVEVAEREVCLKRGAKGECEKSETRCAVGSPFVMPDYSKPYVVDIKSGFGKAGAEVEIVDGWRLGKAKDTADNTAVLGLLEKIAEAKILKAAPQDGVAKCKVPGLYRVSISDGVVELAPLKVY